MTTEKHWRCFFYDLQFRVNCQSSITSGQWDGRKKRKSSRQKSLLRKKQKRLLKQMSCIDKVLLLCFFLIINWHWLIEMARVALHLPNIFSSLTPTPVLFVGRLNEVKDKIERKIACHLNVSLRLCLLLNFYYLFSFD